MIGIIELGSSIMSPPYLTIYCRHRSSYVVINLHWSVALKMKRVPTMRRGRGMASLLAKQKPRPGPREKEKGKQKPVPNPKERHPKLLWLTQNLRAKSKENPQPRERNEQHQRVARKSRLSMKLHQLQPGKQTHRWQSSNLFRILHSQKHPWKPTRHWQRKLMRKNRSSLQSPRPSLEELAHPHVPQTWPTLHQKREHGWARDRRRRRLNPKGEILCLKGVPMNLCCWWSQENFVRGQKLCSKGPSQVCAWCYCKMGCYQGRLQWVDPPSRGLTFLPWGAGWVQVCLPTSTLSPLFKVMDSKQFDNIYTIFPNK